jgi:hypothetical protein
LRAIAQSLGSQLRLWNNIYLIFAYWEQSMMGETGVPVENHRPATSKDTIYYIKCYRVHLTTGTVLKTKIWIYCSGSNSWIYFYIVVNKNLKKYFKETCVTTDVDSTEDVVHYTYCNRTWKRSGHDRIVARFISTYTIRDSRVLSSFPTFSPHDAQVVRPKTSKTLFGQVIIFLSFYLQLYKNKSKNLIRSSKFKFWFWELCQNIDI